MFKKTICIGVSILMIVSLITVGVMTSSAATNGSCGDNAVWEYDTTTNTLIISGTGDIGDYRNHTGDDQNLPFQPWNSFRSQTKNLVIEDGITGIGHGAFYSFVNIESVTIPNSVNRISGEAFEECSNLTSITIPGSVTSIGERAFHSCESLTSVVIPESVTSIGESAFFMSGLTSIDIPNSVTSISQNTFYGCKSLTTVTIPESVTSIGESAFFMSGLTSLEIPNSVTSIGNSAFENCAGLTSITIPDSVKSIGENAFSECKSLTSVILPMSFETMGDHVFEYYNNTSSRYRPLSIKNLTVVGNGEMPNYDSYDVIKPWNSFKNEIEKIVIKNEITSIGNEAFNCTALKSVDIPGSVTSIGKSAFSGCKSLTSVDIPHSVTEIGEFAFSGCSSLTSVDIPNSVTSIGGNAFTQCDNLSSINIPDSVTSIGPYVFFNCFAINTIRVDSNNPVYDSRNNCNAIIETATNTITEGSNTTVIPTSITAIGQGAFGGRSIDTITIPDSVTIIGDGAFMNNLNFHTIDIPNSVTSIGEWAFNVTGLTSVSIPDSVTAIGDNAFSECWELTSITIPDSVKSFGGDSVFGEIQGQVTVYTYSTATEVIDYCEEHSVNYVLLDVEESFSWKLENGTLWVNGEGDMPDFTYENPAPWYEHADEIKNVIIEDGITSIGNFAFSECYEVESVLIPNTVTSIGDDAFIDCGSLTTIIIPNSVVSIGNGSFDNTGLTSVEIPDSVTSIGDSAFEECSKLTKITIPDSVVELGDSIVDSQVTVYTYSTATEVIDYCEENSINYVILDSPQPDEEPFSWKFENGTLWVNGEGDMPDFTYENPAPWYEHADEIKNVIIKDGITSIGNSAFSECYEVESVLIPNTVTSIGDDAFIDCGSLTTIIIPNSVVSIGNGSFDNTGLTSVEIPDSVTSIGGSAFEECSKLTKITIPDSVVELGDSIVDSQVTVYTYSTATEVIDYCEGNDISYVLIDSSTPTTSNEINVSGNSGTTQVLLDYESTTFKVTVPTVLPYDVDENGNVTVATNAKIINQCNGQVDVTAVRAETQNGWAVVANGTDFKKVPVDSKQFTMTLNSDNFPEGTSPSLTLGSAWTTISGKSELALPYSGDFAVQSNPLDAANVANVIFTVGWHTAG